MGIEIILTVIGSSLTVIGTVVGLFLWTASKIDNLASMMHLDMRDFHNGMKDFHGRLCSLEERMKDKT